MRAIEYRAYGARPQLVELPEPTIGPTDAIVAVRATGVCRSDWHAWRGHDPVPLPMVPGHEFAGTVLRVGEQVTRFRPGERVCAPFVMGCGDCEWCRVGQAQVCPKQGQPGFTYPGSFAEQVVVPAADFNLVELPELVDFVSAAALGCRYATAFHALTAQGRLAAGEWLLVVGCGGVGLSAIQLGHALGARVIAVDPGAAARRRATELGAELVLERIDQERIEATTSGGPQLSLDAVGSAATAAGAVTALRRRGRHLQVGLMLAENATAPLPWGAVVAKELAVFGCHGMAAAEYPALLALIASGAVDPGQLVGRTVDLRDAGAELMAMNTATSNTGGLVVAVL